MPATDLVVVPEAIDFETATAVVLQGMTAHYLVHDTHPVAPGDVVLVHAGAGGMGLLLCQMASALGARVLATTSSEEKDALAREAGAHETLRYGDDLADRVRALTDGEGVAVVYDGVGASTFDASLASLRVRGVLALYGAASGPVPPVDPQRLNSGGSLYLTRPSLHWHVRTPEELRRPRRRGVLGRGGRRPERAHRRPLPPRRRRRRPARPPVPPHDGQAPAAALRGARTAWHVAPWLSRRGSAVSARAARARSGDRAAARAAGGARRCRARREWPSSARRRGLPG